MENSIIMQQLISLFDKKNILTIMTNIGITILTKYVLDNTPNFGKLLIYLLKKIFYKKEYHKVSGIGIYLNTQIRNYGDSYWSDYRLLTTTDTHNVIFHKLRFCPVSPKYTKIMNISDQPIKYTQCSKDNINIVPSILFPSRNFKQLTKIINDNIAYSTLHQIIPISLVGESGLGKSKSLDYLAYHANVDYIKKINILDSTHNSIFDYGIGIIIIEHINCNIETLLATDVNSLTFIIFHNLLHATDCHATDYDVFIKVVFCRMDKTEFIEYLYWLGDKLDMPVNVDETLIPDDFSTTYRNLNQVTILNNYDIQEICKNILYVKPKPPVIPVLLNTHEDIIQVIDSTSYKYKKMSIEEYGNNIFSDELWEIYYTDKCNLSPQLENLYIFLISTGKLPSDRVINVMNYLYETDYIKPRNLALEMISISGEHVYCFVEWIKKLRDDGSSNPPIIYKMITRELVIELEKYQTYIIDYLFKELSLRGQDVELAQVFNIPGEIPFAEWFDLIIHTYPIMYQDINKFLTHKYTYIYKVFICWQKPEYEDYFKEATGWS